MEYPLMVVPRQCVWVLFPQLLQSVVLILQLCSFCEGLQLLHLLPCAVAQAVERHDLPLPARLVLIGLSCR